MWCVLVFAGFAVVVPRGGDAFLAFSFLFLFVLLLCLFLMLLLLLSSSEFTQWRMLSQKIHELIPANRNMFAEAW